MEKAKFAAGCFWGVESAFRNTDGVVATSVGFTGGATENPSYYEVCTTDTGHAEVVEVEYDPTLISYEQLLDIFWNIHDPTSLNRQGPDVGTQYRSAIFYDDDKQRAAAISSRDKLQASGQLAKDIVTEIAPAPAYYLAEDYHQQYHERMQGTWTGCRT